MKNSVDETDRSSFNARLMGNLTAANAAWPASAQEQMLKMVEQIATRDKHVQGINGTNWDIPYKAGRIAEEIHAETFNLEAILQNNTARALTDRDAAWPLSVNHPSTDAVIVDKGEILSSAQSKYCGTPKRTAAEMREVRPDGSVYYEGVDKFVGPSDQVHPTDGTPSIQDVLSDTQKREASSRAHVEEAAEYVEGRVTDRLGHDGIESRPTTLREARDVARDNTRGQEMHEGYQGSYMDQSTLQQMGKAAAGAAAISAIIAGTLSTAQYLKLVKAGKISQADAVIGIVKNTAIASADSALKAAAAAGAVSVVTRLA